jgi:homoserine O-acetyltransferase
MDTRDQAADGALTSGALKHVQHVTFDTPFELELGGALASVTVAYETYGTLNEAKDNAILVCHALSGDSHVAMHDGQDDPGWWDACVGPGKGIDTKKYFIICANVLGGCRGTTGPGSINPETHRPYGNDFPTITTRDMVDVQAMLVEHLGIESLLAVVGGSMGGQATMCWATRYPNRVRGIIPIATTPRVSSQTLAFDVVGRNAIMQDPNFRDGQYYDDGPRPDVGLALARMIAHITYLSPEAMNEKFEADRYQAILGRIVPRVSGRAVCRSVRCEQLYPHHDGDRPVRSWDDDGADRPLTLREWRAVADCEFLGRLAVSACGKSQSRPGVAWDRQARDVLQRPERGRP